jgi:hypothetical protein
MADVSCVELRLGLVRTTSKQQARKASELLIPKGASSSGNHPVGMMLLQGAGRTIAVLP